MSGRFAARFMNAAVDAGSTIAHMKRAATEAPGSLTRMRNAQAAKALGAAMPTPPVKTSGEIRAVLPSVEKTLSDYAGGEIVLHGSPIPGLKTIEPKLGSAALPDRAVAYGWKTRGVSGYDDADVLQGVAWSNLQSPRYTKPGSSVYIARAKPGSAVTDYDAPDSIFTSSEPMEVLAELSGDMIETDGTIDAFKMLKALKDNLEKLGVTHHIKKAPQSVDEMAEPIVKKKRF